MGDYRSDYRKIAEETMRISEQGYYLLNGEKVVLVREGNYDFSFVKVFDTEKLEAIRRDEDGFFARFVGENRNCRFKVVESDSFEAARGLEHPLVMNFANARHPGGGFLNGARAQEESLCRCSTLYQSINSKKADEMYRYNLANPSPVDSDYMLLSPNVCVFRDAQCSLLEKPYNVGVWTMPAPNLYGRAADVGPSKMAEVMKERLRKFLTAAAGNGYRNLVLGAWGCGAFGHDAKVVAGYFKELFFAENYRRFFDVVVFAVMGNGYNLRAFEEAFGEIQEVFPEGNGLSAAEKRKKLEVLTQSRRKCDACAHVKTKVKINLYNSAQDTALDADAIGQWTVWNGNPDAEYMIVGQDWGTKNYLEEFRTWQKTNRNLPYEAYNPTNQHLAECIKMLNPKWDILEEKGIEDNARYPLYFTNEILCYKDQKLMNADIPSACFRECTGRYLLEQIEIVEPKAVVFLGADAFRNFVDVAKARMDCRIELKSGFGDILDEVLGNEVPVIYHTASGKAVRVFPMWHTGGLGARNAKASYKKRGGNPDKPALEILKAQWEKMAEIMKKNE